MYFSILLQQYHLIIITMKCPLCKEELHQKNTSGFYLCTQCYGYVKDSQFHYSKKQEKQHYLMHNNDVEDIGYQNFVKDLVDQITHHCTSEQQGLDFGCGSAAVTSYLLKKKGYNIDLYDPYFAPEVDYKNNAYDYIFSCEVFEHFYYPKKEIETLLSILKPNGHLIIKTHLYSGELDFDSWYYIKDLTHVFIYTKRTIAYIAQKYNLDILLLQERLIVLRKKGHI
ncbi:class I SAM-dependent methyltransferase [Myroides sp. LJL115]